MSNQHENQFLKETSFEKVTISFDSGGSGGRAYFMGFARALLNYPELLNSINHVTGVSAGGYAAYFLASGRGKEAFRFWRSVCNIVSIFKCHSIQSNITNVTNDLLTRHNPPLKIPLTVYAKLMPSTNPKIETATFRDRISSRFGFKVLEFIYWSVGIHNHDREFALSLPQGPLTEHTTALLRKVLVGGARFLPVIMGPTIKISKAEASEQKERAGIVHDYGLITLVGGIESLIPLYNKSKRSLHFVIVSQDTSEQLWNNLRRSKIRKIVRKYPYATVVLITAKKRLPRAWHSLPNWMSIEGWLLSASYQIGKDSGEDFIKRYVEIVKHNSS